MRANVFEWSSKEASLGLSSGWIFRGVMDLFDVDPDMAVAWDRDMADRAVIGRGAATAGFQDEGYDSELPDLMLAINEMSWAGLDRGVGYPTRIFMSVTMAPDYSLAYYRMEDEPEARWRPWTNEYVYSGVGKRTA